MAGDFARHVGSHESPVEEWSSDDRFIAACAARDHEYRWWIEAHVSRKKALVCTVNFTDAASHVALRARAIFETLTLLD